jgi:hypothetical protein
MAENFSDITLQLASDAVQIQERLILSLRQHLTVDDEQNEGCKKSKQG